VVLETVRESAQLPLAGPEPAELTEKEVLP
jgi:hypothetical protein